MNSMVFWNKRSPSTHSFSNRMQSGRFTAASHLITPRGSSKSASTGRKPPPGKRQTKVQPFTPKAISSFKNWKIVTKIMQLNIHAILYYVSLVFLLLCLSAFLVATPIDTIIQSRNTGQFWNTIIIVGVYALCFVIALVLYVIRIVSTQRALNVIPHSYYVAQSTSMPLDCVKLIETELDRCHNLAIKVRPPEGQVSHAGMMRPALSEGGRLVDTPYEDVIAVSSTMIESKASALHPSFSRPVGTPLREYLGFLQEYGMLPAPSVVDDFLTQYEYARFSGSLLTELQFDMYMESCRKLLVSLRLPTMPDGGENAAHHGLNFRSSHWGSSRSGSFISSGGGNGNSKFRMPVDYSRNNSTSNPIQWNASYLTGNEGFSTDQEAFVDNMTQLSRMTTASSRGGPGASTPYNPGYTTINPIGMPTDNVPSFVVHQPPPHDLSPVNSMSSVLRHTASRITTNSNHIQPLTTTPTNSLLPYSYYHYPSSTTPSISRVTSHSSSANFLSRFRGHSTTTTTHHHYHERADHDYSYTSSSSSSVMSSSHGSVIIRRAI